MLGLSKANKFVTVLRFVRYVITKGAVRRVEE